MRSFGQLWPTLKRLLAYGSPWRKPLSVAVMMLWIAAAAEVSGPLLISYFIDKHGGPPPFTVGQGRGAGGRLCGATISGGGSALRPVFII
ncbi:Multidrug resistance-like ATP-binding protein mdlB [Salmonella enterica subsp. enterica]|uniref:Multidrug resistance-like ATP-binding protein mdlB n=1 Tax=Salmonella enterica I TaxID=59201 RepID=A0A447U8M9_SALET|nr:Multidrug resistance-like ATP-binding protein mdlB [Salmonella enterica subsp. enterica]